MRIIALSTLRTFWQKHPDAETPLRAWYALASRAHWNTPAEIKAAYESAKSSGKYDRVLRQDSQGRRTYDRAYAMSNPQEYFAESTEAYFSKNDFFPFDREELKQHDPEMFALLAKLW